VTRIAVEIGQTAILLCILVCLWTARRSRSELFRKGWRFIFVGFALLLFGSVLDITGNFESLNRFVVVGDTGVQAFLETMVGFFGGFLLLGVGLLQWIPTITSADETQSLVKQLGRTNEELESANQMLQQQIAQGERMAEALRFRAEFERLIIAISSDLINLRPSEIDTAINHALAAIGRSAGVDRSYIFQFSQDGTTVDNTHEWCASGIEPQIEKLKNIVLDDQLPWFAAVIRRHEVFSVPRVAELPPEAAQEKEHFKAQDIRSLVTVPMLLEGKLVGFLGLDSVLGEKEWQPEVIALLKMTANALASALERTRVETALRRSEERFRLMMENAFDGVNICELDPTTHKKRLIFCNERYVEMSGYTEEQLLAVEDISELQVYDVGDEQLPHPHDCFLKGQPVRGIASWKRPDGRQNTFEWTAVPFKLGDRIHIIGIDRDVTSQRRTEEALRDSEQRYRNLVQHARDVIYTHSRDGVFTSLNPAFEAVTGWSCREWLGKAFAPLIHPDDLPLALERMRGTGMGTTSPPYELRIRKKSGEYLVAEFQTTPHIRNGEIVGSLGIARDITERKKAEEELRRSEERLELALEGAELGLWDWNVQTGEVVFDRRCARMLGYTTDEIEPHLRAWERMLHPEDARHVKEALKAQLEGKTPFCETEHRLRAKSGEWKWILYRGTVVEWDDNGKPLRVTGTHLDITDRKKAEEVLRSLSLTDDLTKLFNRRGFTTLGEQQLKLAKRTKREMCLIYLDVDKLKRINDNLGHPQGDVALTATARILEETFRVSDIITRIGGDEFAVLAVETTMADADRLADRLDEKVRSLNARKNHPTYDPATPCSLDELLSRADALMYEHKRSKQSGNQRPPD